MALLAACGPTETDVAFCSSEPGSLDLLREHAVAVLTFDGLFVHDGGVRTAVAGSEGVESFAWASDASGFYVTRGARLEYLPADGGAPRELRGEWRQVHFPAVSRDGRTLAVSANPTDDIGTGWEVWLVGSDGADLLSLVDGYHPAWSSDGSRLFFERHEPSVALASIDLASREVSPFLGAANRDIGVDVSPSGRFAAFSRGHERRLMLYDFRARALLTLASGVAYSQYPSFSSDESMVLYHQQIETSGAVTLRIVACELASGRTAVIESGRVIEAAFSPT